MSPLSAESASLRQQIVSSLHTKPLIDPETEVEHRVQFLADYLTTTGLKGYVLGISGGQDSTLAGRLAQLACERVRQSGKAAEFYAMRLPHGVQKDEQDARIALDFIQPDHSLTVNIEPATSAMEAAVTAALKQESALRQEGALNQEEAQGQEELNDFNAGNIKARQRMIAQYAVAGEKGLLVVGTDHASENVTAFFTKYGDGGADVLPLFGLSKRQGAALLKQLGAPESTWTKIPTADLEDDRPMQPDEEALGVTYHDIDNYVEGVEDVPEAAVTRLEHLWTVGRHKRTLPVTPQDTWWRN